jgi:ABC transporter transmembrane region
VIREANYRADEIRGLYRVVWQVTGRQQLVLIGLATVVAALAAAPLKFQQLVINSLVADGTVARLAWLCAGLLAVTLLSAGLKFVLNYRLSTLGEHIVLRIRERLYTNYVSDAASGAPGVPKRDTLVTMLAAEAESVGAFAGAAIASPLVQLGTLISVIAFIMVSHPLLGALTLCVVAPQAAIVVVMQKHINQRVRERVQALRDASDRISESDFLRVEDEVVADFREIFETPPQALHPQAVLEVRAQRDQHGGRRRHPVPRRLAGAARSQRRRHRGREPHRADSHRRPWRELVSFLRNASTVRVKYALLAQSIMPRPVKVP